MQIQKYFFVLLMFSSFQLFAQTDADYEKTLKQMFEVSGTEAAYKAAITQMMVTLRQQHANVDANIWSEFEKEFQSASLNDLVEMLVPVYSKHMTKSDIEKIIEFYQTPAGKKFAEKTPLITQESMAVGQQWGMKIGQEFERKMKEKGY